MSVEQSVEVRLVGLAEMVGPAQEGEAGSQAWCGTKIWARKQVRLICRGPPVGVAALYLPPYQGEALGEPPSDMKAVEHMASVGEILRDGRLIRAGCRHSRLSPPAGTTRLLDP